MLRKRNAPLDTGIRNPSPIQEASEEAEMMEELRVPPSTDVELIQPLSWWRMWTRRAIGLWRLLQSKAFLPDYFKSHPHQLYVILAIIILVLILPIRIHFWFLFAGLMLGYIYAVPDTLKQQDSRNATLVSILLAPLKAKDKGEKEMFRLSITPRIDAELDHLLSSLLVEIINPWFVPLCISGEDDFQSCVRSTINAAIMNLVRFASSGNKDTLTLIIYGLTNALIVHMEEFRAFESSKVPIDRFIHSGRTKRIHHRSFSDQLEHIRQILGILLKKLLPKQESRSILVNSLLKEVLSGAFLHAFIEKASDPDFINELIVKALSDPSEYEPDLPEGWNMVVLKVLRGRHLTINESAGGLYLVIHIGSQRVSTRRIRSSAQLWNEVFRFKLSDAARANFKMYVQLCQFNYMGQDSSRGYCKLVPDFSQPGVATPLWLKFNLKANPSQPPNRTEEVLVEVTTFKGPCGTELDKFKVVEPADGGRNEDSPQIQSLSPSPVLSATPLQPEASSRDDVPPSCASDHGFITLEMALQNNELFVEFLEYLESVKAPPYLQFMMNVDALRQYAAMSLGIDNKNPSAIDDYFRTGQPLLPDQLQQLKMIKHDAADVYSTHFTELARYRVPLDPGMQQELQEWVSRSDRLDDANRYCGGPIGPNIFVPAYRWVANVLKEVYFPKFKNSDVFHRFLDRAQFSTLNFSVNNEDDRLSIFSQDSGAIPPGWAYGDQAYVERQQKTLSAGFRSRNSSFDDLKDVNLGDTILHSDPTEECKKLASEITLERRKLVKIEDRLEELRHHPDYDAGFERQLLKEMDQLRKNIDNLVNSLQELESKENEAQSEDLWMDLKDAKIKVQFAVETPIDQSRVFSSLVSTMESVISAVSEPTFDVYVETPSSSSVVRRSYTEFYRLYSLLKAKISKVGMIGFPEQGLLSSEGLDESLQTFLQLLVSDEFIRQNTTLKEFMTLEGAFDTDYTPAIAMMRKKMKDAFKTATSMIAPSQPDEQRRSRFYETKERHTSVSINSTQQSDLLRKSPAFHSANDLRDLSGRPRDPIAPGHGTPVKRRDSAGTIREDRNLERVPSVELPPTPRKMALPKEETAGPTKQLIEELSDEEIEMLIETLFAFIIETFDLREPNQWLRRKLLGVFKQLLKQAYGDTMNKLLTSSVNSLFSESSILRLLQSAHNALFPDGEFIGRRPPPLPRSEEQKFATMVEARTIFLRYTPDILQNMAGRYNAICGMTRIFHSLQHKELNKALLFAFLDIVVKLVFSDKVNAQPQGQ